MGCEIREFSPDYLEEKFNSYFGMKPKKITVSQNNIIDQYVEFCDWKSTWKCDYSDYLFFIFKINTKSLDASPNRRREIVWRPSELISLFEEFVGDPNMIVNHEYNGLHQKIKYCVKYWESSEDIIKDYKVVMRDIKLDNIFS